MNYNLKEAFSFIDQEEKTMKKLWVDLCKYESPSADIESVNAATEFLEKNLKDFGMTTKIRKFPVGANSISAYFDNGSKDLETP